MKGRSSLLAAAPMPVVLTGLALARPPQGPPGRVDHPNLRAALHELRDARQELRDSRGAWPPGHKERAMQALEDAVNSLRTILAVKEVDTFRGKEVDTFRGDDRVPDYYRRYGDHPRLRAALEELRRARDELRGATADFRGMKGRAMDDIEVAIGEIVTLMRVDNRPGRPR